MIKHFLPVIILFILVLPLSAAAQEQVEPEETAVPEPPPFRAYFVMYSESALVGEPFEMDFVIEVPDTVTITQWPEFPEEWGAYVIQEVSDPKIEAEGDITTYTWRIRALVWELGQHRTPELLIPYQLEGQPVVELASSRGLINVPTVLSVEDLELRPLKSAVDLPYLPWWQVVLTACVGTLTSYALTRRFLVYRQAKRWVNTPLLTPYEKARNTLENIENRGQSLTESFPAIADCLREYLVERFAVPAQHQTTSELVEDLQQTQFFPQQMIVDLQQLLEQADIVKFTDLEPEGSLQHTIRFAISWLVDTDTVGVVANE